MKFLIFFSVLISLNFNAYSMTDEQFRKIAPLVNKLYCTLEFMVESQKADPVEKFFARIELNDCRAFREGLTRDREGLRRARKIDDKSFEEAFNGIKDKCETWEGIMRDLGNTTVRLRHPPKV